MHFTTLWTLKNGALYHSAVCPDHIVYKYGWLTSFTLQNFASAGICPLGIHRAKSGISMMSSLVSSSLRTVPSRWLSNTAKGENLGKWIFFKILILFFTRFYCWSQIFYRWATRYSVWGLARQDLNLEEHYSQVFRPFEASMQERCDCVPLVNKKWFH